MKFLFQITIRRKTIFRVFRDILIKLYSAFFQNSSPIPLAFSFIFKLGVRNRKDQIGSASYNCTDMVKFMIKLDIQYIYSLNNMYLYSIYLYILYLQTIHLFNG